MTARSLRGLHLHFDCASGCAGDMMLGALIDAGVPREVVLDSVTAMGMDRGMVAIEETVKGGIAATDVSVKVDGGPHDHHHDHHHYSDIRGGIASSALPAVVIERALDIFDRLARAEAKLHGVAVDDVAFHEVGAIDSIVDVVGAAAALTWLAPASVTASAVAMGSGTVGSSHGVLPVPSPAALEVLREAGALVTDGGVARELCTPTGAAILASIVDRWEPMPAMVPVAIGYGSGDAELVDRPNVLRAVVGDPSRAEIDDVYRVEANVDDMSPEMCEYAADALFAAGALDVWWTPVSMKKSRPALQLSALAPSGVLDAVVGAVVRETTSIGVRFDRVSRRVLERASVEVSTEYGPIPVKVARLDGEVVNAAPEYEACKAAATARNAPLKEVFAAALAAWRASR